MNLDELRSVRRTERQKDSLQHLRDSFYEDVANYIAERKAERKRAADAAEDPFGDPEVGQLTDEIETAEDVVEAIYERRVGKVVKLASFAAADMSADTNGLTAEERELFQGLVARIKQNRQNVLNVLAGEGGDGAGGESSAATGNSSPGTAATASSQPESADPAEAEPAETAPTETHLNDPDDPEAVSPDDVLTDAMGGADPASTDASSADASGSEATTGSPAESARDSPDSDGLEDVPPDLPPDAPPDATAPETPIVGENGEEAGAGNGEPRTDGAPGSVENGGGSSGTAEETDPTPTERVTLRITEDVGQIFGVDEREYDLESEDVVTLPTTNAGPLLERNAAERLD